MLNSYIHLKKYLNQIVDFQILKVFEQIVKKIYQY